MKGEVMYNSYSTSGGDAAGALGGLLGGAFLCYFLFIIVLVAFMIFVFYKIIEKTGNSGWLALLMLVPFGNLGLILWLAFSDWPVLRENRELKAGRTGYGDTFDVVAYASQRNYWVSEARPLSPEAVLLADSKSRTRGGISGNRSSANEEWLSHFALGA